MNRRMTITAALGLSVLLALGACGRKGDLEPPPGMSPDMAQKTPCGNATEAVPQDAPIDAQKRPTSTSAPSQMPNQSLPPC
ncbi:lipoprotein [Parvibaculum sp.]|uniref:LPS translocon maturation chaperone LptM n=1 Tax=Parvibaculum sp. TaxID=2024848 RepID=UPI00320E2A2A